MRAVVTRVRSASVTIHGVTHGKIGLGFWFCWALVRKIHQSFVRVWRKNRSCAGVSG